MLVARKGILVLGGRLIYLVPSGIDCIAEYGGMYTVEEIHDLKEDNPF